MKKIKAFGLLLLATIFMTTACSTTTKTMTPSERIAAANEKMKSLDNYSMKLAMTMGIEADGSSMEMKVNADSQIDEKNGTAKVVTSTNVFGLDTKVTSYAKEENGSTVTYSSSDEKTWTKSTEESATSDVNGILELVKEGTDIKEEAKENGIYHYSLIISKDNVKKLMEEAGNAATETEDFNINGDLTVHIYIDENNNVTKLSMDFTNVINMTGDSEGYKLSKMLFEFDFSNFNTAGDVQIPENVINSAK